MVVVYTGPVSRVSFHQGLLVSDHLIELLQLPLLLCQLILHDSSSSRRRTRFLSPPVTFFSLSADFAPLLVGPVPAPLPAPALGLAVAPAGAPAPAPAPTPVRPLPTPHVPTASAVALSAAAASLFQGTSKLVSCGTPAFTPASAPTPASTMSMPV